MALFAWEAYNQKKKVYCNCRVGNDGRRQEILNFPHFHINIDELEERDLWNCYVMFDEGVEFMDAFEAPKKEMREVSYFIYQAKKRGVDFHIDTVRVKNIYNRVRLNVDGYIETFRYPKNVKMPVQMIRFEVTPRYGKARTFRIQQPALGKLFKIYNHLATVQAPA